MEYIVDVIGRGRRRCASADDAIRYASLLVYVDPDAKDKARQELEAGRIAEWAYGFSQVQIFPAES